MYSFVCTNQNLDKSLVHKYSNRVSEIVLEELINRRFLPGEEREHCHPSEIREHCLGALQVLMALTGSGIQTFYYY